MAERFDVTIGGQGYMVAPGSYRRRQSGAQPVEAGARRVVQRAWAGALQGIEGEDDRYFTSVGLRPVALGQAVGPGPKERAALAVAGLDATAPRYGALAAGRPYFAAGRALWQVDRVQAGANPNNLGGCTGFSWAAPGGLASGLAVLNEANLYVARGGDTLLKFVTGGGGFTTIALNPLGVAAYYGWLWLLGSAAEPNRLQRVTDLAAPSVDPAGWYLDSAVRSTAVVRDALYVGTAGALWRVKGSGAGTSLAFDVQPVLAGGGAGFGDAFAHLAEYGGDIYTWYAGEVMRFHTTAAGGAGLAPTGLRAGSCSGLVVAGGLLIAAVADTAPYGGYQLWAYDGRGWWCLARNTGGGTPAYWSPIATASWTQDADLLASSFGQATLHGFQVADYATQRGLAPAGELVTSLRHGGEPDQDKVWLRVGAEFVTPGRASAPGIPSFGACTVSLAYTLDGTNFTAAGSATIDGAGARTVVFDLPAGTTGKALALKYSLSGVVDGAPSLAALWAEYRAIEPLARRRAWSFEVPAADGTVARDGSLDARTGRQIAAALWGAWQAGATLTFRDIDYDLDPTARSVRIAALDEQVKAPADAGRWGESRLRVELLEV